MLLEVVIRISLHLVLHVFLMHKTIGLQDSDEISSHAVFEEPLIWDSSAAHLDPRGEGRVRFGAFGHCGSAGPVGQQRWLGDTHDAIRVRRGVLAFGVWIFPQLYIAT